MIHTLNKNVVIVGVGDLKVAGIPKILKTSLGSCVGVVLYDNVIKIGGMLHLMLPKCKDRNGKLSKYADTGIPLLVDCMVNRANANRGNLTAKIFGGARMFNISSDMFDIGKSNILETTLILNRLGIRIIAKRLGGTKGHQVSLDTHTGIVQSRILGEPTVKY